MHGEWQIHSTNNYVLQWFSGCWNEEAAVQYTKEYREKTAHLEGRQWAMLSIFEDWQLGVPEIVPHIEQHCQRFKDIGCIKDCHVYSESAVKKIQLEQLIPQTEGDYERRVFTEVDEAVTWLKACDFYVDVSTFLNGLPKH